MAHILKAIQQKKVSVDYEDTKPWPRFSPDDRLKVYRKCGQPCFAKPIEESVETILEDPNVLKFPVCRPARRCKVSAKGLLAASRRARLTKKYPEIAKTTSQLIAKLGTTDIARKEMDILKVRVDETPLPGGKHMITIVYVDGIKKQMPYTKQHILKKYGNYLSKALHKRLSS